MASKNLHWYSFKALVRRMHDGPGNLEELLERHVVKGVEAEAPRLTNTRREALSLYRYILRTTSLFVWPNDQGVPWRDVLRTSARNEFEAARFERDPEIIAKLLVGGRDAVESVLDKVQSKSKSLLTQPAPTDGKQG